MTLLQFLQRKYGQFSEIPTTLELLTIDDLDEYLIKREEELIRRIVDALIGPSTNIKEINL